MTDWSAGLLPAPLNSAPGFKQLEGVINAFPRSEFDVRRDGAGSTVSPAKNTLAIQRTIDRAPAGSTIVVPTGLALSVADALRVTKALRFVMHGATLTQTATHTPLFACSASECYWTGGKLLGPQYLAEHASENAIQVIGASAANPVTDIGIDVTIDTWGLHGVYLQYVTDFAVNVRVRRCWYAGVGGDSVLHGDVTGRVRTIVGTPNAYGVYFSRSATASLVTDPRSEDIECHDMVVRDVPNWEGFDTHAGKNIRFRNVATYGCKFGVALVGAANNLGTATWAPQDCVVDGAYCDSGVTDGSASYGVSVAGATGVVGTPTEYAANCAVRNVTLRGHGDEGIGTSGAIYCHDTLGLQIANVQGIECSPVVVNLTNDNKKFNIRGVTATDTWTNTGLLTVGVFASNDYNSGEIDGVVIAHGTKTATLVNDKGVRVANFANNSIQLGVNDLTTATTPFEDPGSRVTTRIRSLATFDQLVTLTGGMVSLADIDATGGFRCPPGDGWYQNTINANGTVTMTRHATRLAYPTAWFASAAGSIVCLWGILDTTLAVGAQINVEAYINGVFALRLTLLPANGTALARNTSVKDGAGLTFAVGDKIELKTVTTGMSGSTSLMAGITVEAS